jgi:mitochondrial fission protein ELM1
MEWVSPDLLGNAWLMHAIAKDYIAMPTGAASTGRPNKTIGLLEGNASGFKNTMHLL